MTANMIKTQMSPTIMKNKKSLMIVVAMLKP